MVFKKKKGQEEPVSLFLPNHSLCSGLKKEKVVKSLEQGSMCLKGLSFLFVCVSFCPNGEPKSVLIAQTHRQKVILYLPSVVPSFVYLLLNCLRRKKKKNVRLRRPTSSIGGTASPPGEPRAAKPESRPSRADSSTRGGPRQRSRRRRVGRGKA